MTSSLSEINGVRTTIDTIKQRQQGRGQTLVLMNGCNGEVTQSSTTTTGGSTEHWPLGFTHYQIPTQGNAVHFRENPYTYSSVMPVNGPAASDGYRTFQFGGDFQDNAGVNAVTSSLYLTTTSNIITITSPTCAGATSFATSLKEASESSAASTGDRLFQLGGFRTNTVSNDEMHESVSVVTNTASLVQGSFNIRMSFVSGNAETDGDVLFCTGGRASLNYSFQYASSFAAYVSIAQPAVSSNTDPPRSWPGGRYPTHGCSASASDGSIMLVAGGILVDDQFQYLNTPQSVITRYGFRLPGNSSSFGNLTQARVRLSGGSDGSRAVFVGGSDTINTVNQAAVTNYSTMDMVTISTPANATTFGTVQSQVYSQLDDGSGTSTGLKLVSTGAVPSRGYGVASCT